MPNSMINKDAREGKGSKKSLEKDWDESKKDAGTKNGKQNWALTNYIYQKRKNAHASVLNASLRLASFEVHCDEFEGWVNSLQFKYDRPEGADYVIVDVPVTDVASKLYADEWGRAKRSDVIQFQKGVHTVVLEDQNGKCKITSVK